MHKRELVRKFRQFWAGLTENDRIAIVHHSDADGICSALITAKAIERIAGRKPVVVQRYDYGNKSLARKITALMKRRKANALILVDLGIDSERQGLLSKCAFQKCLVIDHHRMTKDLNSKKVLFLKAEFFSRRDPSSYVTSKLAFDLFNKVVDVRDLDWIACLGIMGDKNLKNWRKFVNGTARRRKTSLGKLRQILGLIAAVEVLAISKMEKLFWVFYNAKKAEDVLKSQFKKLLKRFEKEKSSLVKGFEEKAEFFPDLELYFYEMKAKHENIKSYVINEISDKKPNRTVILLQDVGSGKVKFSARRQDGKVKVNDLLIKAVKGIPESSAGGHAPAAAGSTRKKYVARFKANVEKILGKKYGK